MKYGWLIENFCLFPSISINWMYNSDLKRIYDIQLSWLFWYISTDNIGKYLKTKGYY